MRRSKEKLYKRIQEIEVFKKGNFTLSSGKKSNYYIDGRLISLDPTGSELISKIFQKNNVNKAIKLVKMGKVREAEKAIKPAIKYLIGMKCKIKH